MPISPARILSVVIPAYNEERTIASVLERVSAVSLPGWKKEIIVVDDGSRDRTAAETERFFRTHLKIRFHGRDARFLKRGDAAEAEPYRGYGETEPQAAAKNRASEPKWNFEMGSSHIRLLRHEKNRGKGAAIRTGIAAATGDAVIIQDADLEYHPEDWLLMLEAFEKTKEAVIYGSRELHPERRGYPHYVAGVKILTALNNALFGSRLTDIYTCYKLFPRALIQSLPLASDGFEIEAEVTARLLRKGVGIREVPIRYSPRTFRDGKKIRFRDGIIGMRTLIIHRFLL